MIDNNTAQSMYDDLPSSVKAEIGNVNDLQEGLNGTGVNKAVVTNALSKAGVTNPVDPPTKLKTFDRNNFVKKGSRKSEKARVIENLKKAGETQPSERKSVTQKAQDLKLKQAMSDLNQAQVKKDNIRKSSSENQQREVELQEFKRNAGKPRTLIKKLDVKQMPAFINKVNTDQLMNDYIQSNVIEYINTDFKVDDTFIEKGNSFKPSSDLEARKLLYNSQGITAPTDEQVNQTKLYLDQNRSANYRKGLDEYIFNKEGLFTKINALSDKVTQYWIKTNEQSLPENTPADVFKKQLQTPSTDIIKGRLFTENFDNPNSGLVKIKDIAGIDNDDFAKFLWDSGLEDKYDNSLATLTSQDDQANILFKYRDWRSQKENHNYLLNYAKEQRAVADGDEEEALKYNRLKLNSFNKIENDIISFAKETLPSLAKYNFKINRSKQEHADYVKSVDNIKKGNFSYKDVDLVGAITVNESILGVVKLTTGIASSTSELIGDIGGAILNTIGDVTGDYKSERIWRGLFGGTADLITKVNTELLTPDMYGNKVYDSETKNISHKGNKYELRSDGLVYDKDMNLVDDDTSRTILKEGEMTDGEVKINPFSVISTVITQVALMRRAGLAGKATQKAGLGLIGQDLTYILSSYKDNKDIIDEAFPNISENEKAIYAGTLSTVDSMWERINPDTKFLRTAKPSKLIVNTLLSQGKGITRRNIMNTFENQIIKPVAKEMVEEYGVLGTTSLFNNLTNQIYGADKLSAEITADDVINTGIITAASTLVLGGKQTVQSYKLGNMNYEDALIYATRNKKTNAVLKEMINDPKLAESYGVERVEALSNIVHELDKQTATLPNDLSIDGTRRSLPLIEEKIRLNEEKSNTDKIYHANIDRKIEIVDNALSKIYEEDLTNTNKLIDEKTKVVQEDGQRQGRQEIEGRNEESQGRETEIRETEKAESRQEITELTDRLKQTGLAESVSIVNQETFDNKLKEIGKYDESQDVKGFVHDGQIYINEDKATVDTLVHEFSHLWNQYNKETNPELHNEGKTLIENEGQVYIDQVKQNDPTLEGENLIDEALSQAIGDNGALLPTEQKKGFKQWLNNVWESISAKLGITNVKPENVPTMKLKEFIDNARTDLLKGEQISEKPVKVTETKFSRKKKTQRSDKAKGKDFISPETREKMKVNAENRKKGRDQIKEAREQAVDIVKKHVEDLTKGNEFTPREVKQIANTINKYNKKSDKSKEQIDNKVKQIVSAVRKRKSVKTVKASKVKLRKRLASPNQLKGKYADQVKELLRINTGAFTTNQLNSYNEVLTNISEHYKNYSDSKFNKNITTFFEKSYGNGRNVFEHFKEIERKAVRKQFRDGMKKATLQDLGFDSHEIDLLKTPNKNLTEEMIEEKEVLRELEKELRATHEADVDNITDEEIDILYDEASYESSEEKLMKRRELAEKHRKSIIDYAKRIQSRINPNDPKVSKLIGLDIDSMSNEDIIGFNKAVENYTYNDDTTRIEFYNKIAEAQEATVEINAYLRSNFKRSSDNLHKSSGAKEVNALLKKGRNLFLQSMTLNNFLYNMMGSNEKASWMYNKLGLQELSRMNTKSVVSSKQYNEGYESAMKEARKINNRNVDLRDRTENIRRAVMGNLLQAEYTNPDLVEDHNRQRTEKENEFKFREHLSRYLDTSISTYENTSFNQDTADSNYDMANLLKDIKEELKGVNNKAELVEYLKNNDKGNFKLLEYVRDKFLEISEDFGKVSAEVHNLQPKIYTRDDFYLPLRRINMDDRYFQNNKELITNSSHNIQGITVEPVHALDRMKNAKLRTGESIDMDFDTGMHESYGKQQYDINSSPVVKKVSVILSNPEMAKLVGDQMDHLKQRVAFKILGDRGDLKYSSNPMEKFLGPIEKWFRSQMAIQALGGFTQMVRQFPPVVVSALIRQSLMDTSYKNPMLLSNEIFQNGKVLAKTLMYSSKDIPLLQESSIVLRDDKSVQYKHVSDVKEAGKMLGYNKSKAKKRFERVVGTENSILNSVNEMMMWSLRKGDVHAANSTFLMYYAAKLREDGLTVDDFKTEHLKLDNTTEGQKRKDALAYAQHIVNSTQMSSDMTEGNMLLSSVGSGNTSVAMRFLSNALFSFQRMANNSKSRFYIAATNLTKGDAKTKREAGVELASTLSEMVIFQGVKQFMLAPMYVAAVNIISNLAFRDDDKKKGAFEEYMDDLYKYKQKFFSSVIADVSPVSEGITANIGNQILYALDKANGSTKAPTFKQYKDEINKNNKVSAKNGGPTELLLYSFDKQPDAWDWIGGYKIPIDNAVKAYESWEVAYSKQLAEDGMFGNVNYYDFSETNAMGLALHAIMNTLAMAGMMDVDVIRQERKVFNEMKKDHKTSKAKYDNKDKPKTNKSTVIDDSDGIEKDGYESDVIEADGYEVDGGSR